MAPRLALALLGILFFGSIALADQRNFSGSITTGGTFQMAAPKVGNRVSIDFINTSSHTCYLHMDPGVATTANSIPVQSGQEYLRVTQPVPNDEIDVTCTTTADTFYLVVQ